MCFQYNGHVGHQRAGQGGQRVESKDWASMTCSRLALGVRGQRISGVITDIETGGDRRGFGLAP